MKRILVPSLLLLSELPAAAQLTIQPTGNVVIGSDKTAASLSVTGAAAFGKDAAPQRVNFYGDVTATKGNVVIGEDAKPSSLTVKGAATFGTASLPQKFFFYGGMTSTQDVYVGIGDTSLANLYVNGALSTGKNATIGTSSRPADLTVNGSAVIGTSTTAATLKVNGTIEGFGVVPQGAIIDWWRPDASYPVPAGYQICDGSAIVAGSWKGKPLPNLTNKFIRGVTDPSQIGASGGSDSATPSAQTAAANGHDHTLPTITGVPYNGGASSSDPYYVKDDNSGWANTNHLAVDKGNSTSEGQHRHTLSGPTGAVEAHKHTVTVNPVSTIPAYVGLLKIMRIQ